MSPWQGIVAEATDDYSFVLAVAFGISAVVARIVGLERRRMLGSAALCALHTLLLPIVGVLRARGSSLYQDVRLPCLIFAGMAAVSMAGIMVFYVALPRLHLRVPKIVQDVVTGLVALVVLLGIAARAGYNVTGLVATSAVLTAVITLERWRDVTPPHFRFAAKMPASITHELALRRARTPLREFVTRLRGLGTKLGPVLVQLPASHVFDARVCRRFLACLRQEFSGTVVWEPRHPSWFAPAVGALLAHFDVSRVAADPACAPAARLPLGKVTYYRLHGSPRIYYSSYDRKTLIALARALGASPTRETAPWCIFDNTALGAATLNALELQSEIRAAGGPPPHSRRRARRA